MSSNLLRTLFDYVINQILNLVQSQISEVEQAGIVVKVGTYLTSAVQILSDPRRPYSLLEGLEQVNTCTNGLGKPIRISTLYRSMERRLRSSSRMKSER